jgi:hypothetical protein
MVNKTTGLPPGEEIRITAEYGKTKTGEWHGDNSARST